MHLKTLMHEVYVINITNTIMLMLFQDMITVDSDSHNLYSIWLKCGARAPFGAGIECPAYPVGDSRFKRTPITLHALG
jgi:hypothetical protein